MCQRAGRQRKDRESQEECVSGQADNQGEMSPGYASVSRQASSYSYRAGNARRSASANRQATRAGRARRYASVRRGG